MTEQYHGSWRHKMQRLRTVFTQLDRLPKDEVTPDVTIHRILQDIDLVVQDLLKRSKPQ